MSRGKKSEEEELFNFETALIVAWPGPSDPPPRTVRLPGLRIDSWPQRDGSVLYEIKYRNVPFKPKKRRRYHDTVQMMSASAVTNALKKNEKKESHDTLQVDSSELDAVGLDRPASQGKQDG